MNRSMKKITLLLAIAAVFTWATACSKDVNTETISPAETISVETSSVTEEVVTEETMSPELQKALDEGWIMEDWPEETTETTEVTKPQETKPQETKPQETKPQNTVTEYEKYLAMSPEEQQAFFQSFDSVDAYFEWLNNAKAEYEEKQNATEIEDGTIDLSTMPMTP